MNSGTGLKKVEIRLKWDPSPFDEPPHHLDIVAATYSADAPYGKPVYVVHYDSRSPDGTINMSRHSQTGQGFGYVEAMTVELDRLASSFARVVVGVVIHQTTGPKTFGHLTGTGVLVVEGYTELVKDDFARLTDSTAAIVAEFTKETGVWELRPALRGYDSDPETFMAQMGSGPQL
ncbi:MULTISPECIES: TerD family protein [unclassified Streptomyces]|uniref:TerD family protein n=1 Tax=unclassified Streptomyces TaxID=2593676 RepID=UPI000DD642A9|nr:MULTISPECIES: TerD family protein [unclassified Streptomyces]QZZ25156.1 TerD family protein [Streptomyces sp. ST1015]